MAETNALKGFDWSGVTGGGLFLKFEAGKPVTLRVLTVDPVVNSSEFEDKATGDISINTKFNFIVYNFTDKKAQILSATPAMARKIGELDADVELTGGDIKTVDIRISPTGEKLKRRYEIQVMPKANQLTNEQIKEAAAIKLDEVVKDGTRMSLYDPAKYKPTAAESEDAAHEYGVADTVEDLGDDPIDLSDIPF